MYDKYQNIAQDHARVGVQFGQIRGNVSVGSGFAKSDPIAHGGIEQMLDELRHELHAMRAQSEIEAATADAAEQELNTAVDCLPLKDGDSTSKLIIALKRMSGLVEGLVGLGTKVAEAIAAVQGMK